jgi:hypothetical protein
MWIDANRALALALGLPMGPEWILIGGLIAFAVVVLLIPRINARNRRPPTGFPVGPPPIPRFRVSGVGRTSGQDVVWVCDANSPENAQAKAELEGIVVTRVDRIQ